MRAFKIRLISGPRGERLAQEWMSSRDEQRWVAEKRGSREGRKTNISSESHSEDKVCRMKRAREVDLNMRVSA